MLSKCNGGIIRDFKFSLNSNHMFDTRCKWDKDSCPALANKQDGLRVSALSHEPRKNSSACFVSCMLLKTQTELRGLKEG